MTLTAADEVWNRAATQQGGAAPRRGDTLLAAVLLAHGLVMNGGVMHALEVMSREETELARLGYTRLGLPQVASLLVRDDDAPELDDDAEEAELAADRVYGDALPDDTALAERFRVDFEANRDDYAAV